jgi:hypothetical protein
MEETEQDQHGDAESTETHGGRFHSMMPVVRRPTAGVSGGQEDPGDKTDTKIDRRLSTVHQPTT